MLEKTEKTPKEKQEYLENLAKYLEAILREREQELRALSVPLENKIFELKQLIYETKKMARGQEEQCDCGARIYYCFELEKWKMIGGGWGCNQVKGRESHYPRAVRTARKCTCGTRHYYYLDYGKEPKDLEYCLECDPMKCVQDGSVTFYHNRESGYYFLNNKPTEQE